MVRNSYEDLVSRRFFVDVVKGFVVIVVGFVLLLGELLNPSVPFPFYVIKGFVNFFLSLSLFAGVVVLLLSLVFGDFSIGGGRSSG